MPLEKMPRYRVSPAPKPNDEQPVPAFKCPICGEQNHLLFDASRILERPYEGLYFLVTIEGGKLVIRPFEKDMDYLEDSNYQKHCQMAIDMWNDEELDAFYCPTCTDSIE